MRRLQWTAAAAIVLSCAACSKPAPSAAPAAQAPAEAAPAPLPAQSAPDAGSPTSGTPTQPAPSEAAAPPPAPVQHLVASRERRIRALLNNAMARDVTGEVEYEADRAAARRAACRTQACVDQSYAAQEASLRKWEGSDDIR